MWASRIGIVVGVEVAAADSVAAGWGVGDAAGVDAGKSVGAAGGTAAGVCVGDVRGGTVGIGVGLAAGVTGWLCMGARIGAGIDVGVMAVHAARARTGNPNAKDQRQGLAKQVRNVAIKN